GSTTADGGTIDLDTASVQDVLNAIDAITGAAPGSSSISAGTGQVQLYTGTSDLTISTGTGNALAALGLSAFDGATENAGAPTASGNVDMTTATLLGTATAAGTSGLGLDVAS